MSTGINVGVLGGHSPSALMMALYVVPAFVVSGLLIPVVPRLGWVVLTVVAWAFAAALGAELGVELDGARLLQSVVSGLLLGCVCALPWLVLQLGAGVFPGRHAVMAKMLEVAVLWAFVAGGGFHRWSKLRSPPHGWAWSINPETSRDGWLRPPCMGCGSGCPSRRWLRCSALPSQGSRRIWIPSR
ncbi:MAG: hypothetical protein IPL79_02915 [Myxococcales bacterium]|nr:hypothetical protein [Myxococcales bacterium]